MEIIRDQLIRKTAEESGYYIQNVRDVFNAMENVIIEYFENIDDNEPISVKILSYLTINGYVVPERERVNPQDRTPVICPPTVKILAKCGDGLKNKVQKIYDEKKAQ